MVERQRDDDGTASNETSYCISSLKRHAETLANSIRSHWCIENGLRGCLDASFREDDCRVRQDHAPENFAILRHMAINLIKQEKTLKGGIQTKRMKAAWDHKYLIKILKGYFFTCNRPASAARSIACKIGGKIDLTYFQSITNVDEKGLRVIRSLST